MKPQEVFCIFFAIFWGVIANVQPRWKAFQFPLMFKPELNVVRRRVLLAILFLNVLPIVYFGVVLHFITSPEEANSIRLVLRGVLPAFGVFGWYRFWISMVEWKPDCFYKHDINEIPEQYRHVEPTYSHSYKEAKGSELPVVHLAKGASFGNCMAGASFLVVAVGVPCVLSMAAGW
jgi:hypothetical protein